MSQFVFEMFLGIMNYLLFILRVFLNLKPSGHIQKHEV